ncbi:ClpP/crotonase-like domain-containing protein [Xylogone sp. PMI_703]|nr:ClpP/crotonase-like domain-containing protein [Xylogone sp. PMI_703]
MAGSLEEFIRRHSSPCVGSGRYLTPSLFQPSSAQNLTSIPSLLFSRQNDKMGSNGYPSSFDKEPNAVQVNKSAEGITTIMINRHRRRNAVDGPTGKKLTDAFLDFENDHSQKVCVFYGTNGNFCAGFDLHEVAKFEKQKAGYVGPRIRQDERVEGRNIGPIGPSRMQIRKPIISAVSGYAVAGGLELSLLGDIRVAEEDAIFGVFCRRWGVPLIDGGTVRLQAIIGLGRALDMILTGRGVGAQEALMMGLANRVVPKGKALEEATNIARQLITFPQGCMNADRTSCYYAVYNASSFEDALSFEYDNGIKVIDSESVKGAAKFSAGAGRHGKFEFEGKL